jgi:hypothetical protein
MTVLATIALDTDVFEPGKILSNLWTAAPLATQTLHKQGGVLCSPSIMMGLTEYARPSTERSVRDGTSL